jgi:hypothetical protein
MTTNRSARKRGLLFGALLVIAPVSDVLAGGAAAGLMHLVSALAGIAVLAASLSFGGRPRLKYERYDPS